MNILIKEREEFYFYADFIAIRKKFHSEVVSSPVIEFNWLIISLSIEPDREAIEHISNEYLILFLFQFHFILGNRIYFDSQWFIHFILLKLQSILFILPRLKGKKCRNDDAIWCSQLIASILNACDQIEFSVSVFPFASCELVFICKSSDQLNSKFIRRYLSPIISRCHRYYYESSKINNMLAKNRNIFRQSLKKNCSRIFRAKIRSIPTTTKNKQNSIFVLCL